MNHESKIYLFAREIFYILTAALFGFGVIELFWDRLVLAYININYLLIFWLVFGMVLLLTKKEK